MIRGNLPAAMQGLVVVPLFAGYDEKRATGPPLRIRRHRRPLRRARLRRDRLGQPARRHGDQARLRDNLTRDESIDLAIKALFHAADEDSATGGPDLMRGIFPVVATVEREGFVRVPDADLAQRTTALLEQLRANRGGLPR